MTWSSSNRESLQTDSAELIPFGWWFASGKPDDEWCLAQLTDVLHLANQIDPDYMVVRHLAEIVEEHPTAVVRSLATIVGADQEAWSIHGWLDDARRILQAAVASHEPDARNAAIDLIHRLGARGHWELRNLLPEDHTDSPPDHP